MSERNSKGQFLPGVSGNPGGRPKGLSDARKQFQERTQKALDALDRILEDPEEIGSTAQLGAIREVLLRAWGKPQSAEEIERADKTRDEGPPGVTFQYVQSRSDLPKEAQEALDKADE